jgi:ATP-dependent Clp protease protease subunit
MWPVEAKGSVTRSRTPRSHASTAWRRGRSGDDIEIMAKEILRLKDALNNFFAGATGQPIEVIKRDTDRDFFLTAEQAVSYGIVDKVLQPPVK